MRVEAAVVCAVVCALLFASSTAAAGPGRDPSDADQIVVLRAVAPHAVALLEEGESLGAAGRFEKAEALFRQATMEKPDSAILWRRECEALTSLGRRNEAVAACERAVQNHRTNVDLRSLVHAYVGGPTPPANVDVARALYVLANEREQARPPWAAEMACDIAEATGDGMMLQHCTEELESVAPDEPQTRRAMAMLQSKCPPWRFWLGWCAIFAAMAATLGHAVRRRYAQRGGRRSAAPALAAIVLSCAVPRMAFGADPAAGAMLSKWPIDDEHPEKSIPSEKDRNADPLQFGYWLQDLAWKGEMHSKHGDHAAAVRYFAAMGLAVPDRAIPWIKLCEEFEALHELKRAIESCANALLRDGLELKDYTRFVHLVLSEPGPLDEPEVSALNNVLQKLKNEPAAHGVYDDLECEIGVRTSNLNLLEECTPALASRAPDDPKTISYQWTLAMQENDFGRANQIIKRATALGVPSPAISAMQKATSSNRARYRIRWVLSLLAGALALAGLAIGVKVLSQRGSVRRRRSVANSY